MVYVNYSKAFLQPSYQLCQSEKAGVPSENSRTFSTARGPAYLNTIIFWCSHVGKQNIVHKPRCWGTKLHTRMSFFTILHEKCYSVSLWFSFCRFSLGIIMRVCDFLDVQRLDTVIISYARIWNETRESEAAQPTASREGVVTLWSSMVLNELNWLLAFVGIKVFLPPY